MTRARADSRDARGGRGSLKQAGAILLAIVVVLLAGTAVGQAPILFGAMENDQPEASLDVTDGTGTGATLTVENATLSEGGFLVASNETGDVVGVSSALDEGDHENVTIEARNDALLLGELTVTAHRDTGESGAFEYAETGGEEDEPYTDDGEPVRERVSVISAETSAEEDPTASFAVENVSTQSAVVVNETVTVNATVANENGFETDQHVELRIDGEVIERRIVTLEAGTSTDVRFEFDAGEPGSHDVGVFTVDDGAVESVVVSPEHGIAFDDQPVTNASLTVAAVDAPNASVLAIETDEGGANDSDSDNALLGTTTLDDARFHENVTVTLDEVPEPGETVVATLYPDTEALEAGEPLERDGQPLADDATIQE